MQSRASSFKAGFEKLIFSNWVGSNTYIFLIFLIQPDLEIFLSILDLFNGKNNYLQILLKNYLTLNFLNLPQRKDDAFIGVAQTTKDTLSKHLESLMEVLEESGEDLPQGNYVAKVKVGYDCCIILSFQWGNLRTPDKPKTVTQKLTVFGKD